MFGNDWVIFKMQLQMAVKEKIVFFYTLGIPIIMAFLNKGPNFHGNEVLYIYWAYIVVTTVLNGFLMKLAQIRSSGFFNRPSPLIESRFSVLMTAFFSQLLIIQAEIIFFNLATHFLITPVSPYTFLYGFLVSFLTTIVSISMMSLLLLLKIRQTSFTMIVNIFLLIGLLLLHVRPAGTWNFFLTAINPFQFIYALYAVPCIFNLFSLMLGVITIVYLIIGVLILSCLSKRD